jgi:hypothetical protein
VATFQTTALAAGSHKLIAVWYGDSNNLGSNSAVITETINPASSVVVASSLAFQRAAPIAPATREMTAAYALAADVLTPGARALLPFTTPQWFMDSARILSHMGGNADPSAVSTESREQAVQVALQMVDHLRVEDGLQEDWVRDLLLGRG